MKKGILANLFALIHTICFCQLFPTTEPIKYLALGDSYTIGQSVSYQQRWPRFLFDSLKNNGFETDTIHFIATTGWRTDNLLSAITQAKPDSTYNLVSLLIGVNNQYQNRPISQYTSEFPRLLHWAIALAGGDKNSVFVVSIPDYMYTPFGSGYSNPQAVSNQLDEYNAIAKAFCDTADVRFYDITPISRKGFEDPQLVASDGLHPSGKQYKQWVHFILSKELLTAANTQNKGQLVMYPNPIQEFLIIPPQVRYWQLFDLGGLIIEEGNDYQLDVKNINPGTYVFRGYDNDNRLIIAEKLAIKKQASY